MSIRIAAFTGEIPRLIPRLLPNSAAQAAENTKLENGAIMPVRRGRYAHHLDEPAQAIYLHGDEWLSWSVPVNVVPAPIAENRLYITGDGVPKVRAAGSTYPLALQRPLTPPAAALVSGSPDPTLQQTILYAYTWVTALDEESEPSPVSNPLLWSPGLDVQVTGFVVPAADRAINRMRIYRSQTSALGETQLYFIAERAVGITPFVDVIADHPFAEPLASLDYNTPPDGLAGLIALPNGIMAAFEGKKLYFSEPYKPHAWPEKYILTVDFPIMGLGVFGSAVAVLTQGQPYVVAGTSPDTMSMEKLEVNLPCVSARGIVDLGASIAYPSTDGLVVISQSGANTITRNLITRDDWLRMNPYSFVAGSFNGRYLTCYAFTDGDGIERTGMLIIDLTGETPFITRGSDSADAMFSDTAGGALYLLKNGEDIYEWDAISTSYGEMYWRSKRFVLPADTNFGAILIEGESAMTPEQRAASKALAQAIREANEALIDGDVTGGTFPSMPLGLVTFAGSLLSPVDEFEPLFLVTVYADGKPVADIVDMNLTCRLPGGFLARTWEVEVRGNQLVTAISIGASPSELAAG
ncbi:hypothetical protein LWE61_14975 [Sphingobium sufflavum]|uniref:hypothetical protein n=1 Tax=Sphingobium sufflavum TaxID=1129547 RepID=UPI001F2DC54E|nr:hypothetical protein [Sphingobium sufflavum]MCE7797853.1 hypothetical protein [Sphingobium sufflavum]